MRLIRHLAYCIAGLAVLTLPSAAVQGQVASADTTPAALNRADSLVWGILEGLDEPRYGEAAAAYLSLIGDLASRPADGVETLRARHLVPLFWVLPDDVREATGIVDREAALQAELPPAAGARLQAWWRSQDTQPATRANERLEEHLMRVAYVRRVFADTRTELGYDGRGEVYVRLGRPSHATPVGVVLNDPPSTTLANKRAPYYPEGVFWVYRHVDSQAQYLFVRSGDEAYHLGEPTDLIPRGLRLQRSSLALMEAMRKVYRMLALYHPHGHYGSAYEEIEDYLGLLHDVASARTLPSPRSTAVAQPPSPHSTSFSTVSRVRAEDRRAVNRREQAVQRSYSNQYDRAEPLPVAMRWARFLDDDGTTRTEIHWGADADALEPSRRQRRRLRRDGHEPSGAYQVDLTVVRQGADYLPLDRMVTPYRIDLEDAYNADGTLPPASVAVPGDTGRFNLALQWDAYLMPPPAGRERGPRVKFGSIRLDSLQALNPDPTRLEMSDLVALRVPDGAGLDEATIYPYRTITPGLPLALAFDVYHLVYGADDLTHFTVAYEVARSRERGGLLDLRRDDDRTRAEASYTADRRTARETVILDLGDWEGEGELDVIVHVTDTVTGETVSRTLSFDARQPH